jgi:hypothetical protein
VLLNPLDLRRPIRRVTVSVTLRARSYAGPTPEWWVLRIAVASDVPEPLDTVSMAATSALKAVCELCPVSDGPLPPRAEVTSHPKPADAR